MKCEIYIDMQFNFRYYYFYIMFLISQVLRYFHLIPPLEIKAKPKTDIEIYEESYKPKFLGTYAKDIKEYNSNIDAVFYLTKEYAELLKDEDNTLEKQWRTRILYESTPRGNIALFYDVFKQAFSYYSDQSIPYNMLNVAAMKYCVTFRCCDFFMDENVIPEGSSSALLNTIRADEKTEIMKNKKAVSEMLPDIKNANFAKFKNYANKPVTAESKKTDSNKPEAKEVEKSINRFLYLGKMNNFAFIQKVPKKKVFIKTATKYDNMFGQISREKVDYKTFRATTRAQAAAAEPEPSPQS